MIAETAFESIETAPDKELPEDALSKDAPSKEIEENEYIKILYNWGEIYRYIKELEKETV